MITERFVQILTDDVTDLPRSTFLQLGKNVGLECQRCNSEEKLFDVFSYSMEETKISVGPSENEKLTDSRCWT